MVAVERLDHAREAEALRGGDRVVLGLHHLAPRNGEPGTVEEAVGQLLVGRDVDGDPAGPAGHRRADPLLVDALAQLDEAEPVEADVRDVAPGGLVEQRLGADGPNASRSASRIRSSSSGTRSKSTVSSLGATRWLTSPTAFLPAARPTCSSRYSKITLYRPYSPVLRVLPWRTSVPARFWNSRAMCSATWPSQVPSLSLRDEPAAPAEAAGVVVERREHLDQGVDEPGDRVARELLEDAEVDDLPDHRLGRPVVRAAEDARLEDPEAGLGALAWWRRRRRVASGRRAPPARRSAAAALRARFAGAGSACATVSLLACVVPECTRWVRCPVPRHARRAGNDPLAPAMTLASSAAGAIR